MLPTPHSTPTTLLVPPNGTLLVQLLVNLATHRLIVIDNTLLASLVLQLEHIIACNQVILESVIQHVVARNREHMATLVQVTGLLLEVTLVVVLGNN